MERRTFLALVKGAKPADLPVELGLNIPRRYCCERIR
jgi:hypothetical protein